MCIAGDPPGVNSDRGKGTILHGCRNAAVGVALTQHRVDGAAEHLGVARLDLSFGVIGRLLGIVRDIVAVGLQFLDRCDQLWNGRTDIGQLDDVGFRRLGQGAEMSEFVLDALLGGEVLGEVGEDPTGERNIA